MERHNIIPANVIQSYAFIFNNDIYILENNSLCKIAIWKCYPNPKFIEPQNRQPWFSHERFLELS